MASSIIAKTITATGTFNGGRTRLKSFVVRSAGSGSPAAVFKNKKIFPLHQVWGGND